MPGKTLISIGMRRMLFVNRQDPSLSLFTDILRSR